MRFRYLLLITAAGRSDKLLTGRPPLLLGAGAAEQREVAEAVGVKRQQSAEEQRCR